MDERKKIVIIATQDEGKALQAIFSKAPNQNTITLQYSNQFAGIVELLVRKLRLGAGWIETDRGFKEVNNKKCIFNKGQCTNKEKLKEENITDPEQKMKCIDSIRENCPHYKQLNNKSFTVGFVTIEKIGQIRSL